MTNLVNPDEMEKLAKAVQVLGDVVQHILKGETGDNDVTAAHHATEGARKVANDL